MPVRSPPKSVPMPVRYRSELYSMLSIFSSFVIARAESPWRSTGTQNPHRIVGMRSLHAVDYRAFPPRNDRERVVTIPHTYFLHTLSLRGRSPRRSTLIQKPMRQVAGVTQSMMHFCVGCSACT